MELGQYLKKMRKEKKITLREAAKRSGVSHPYLSQLENGKNDKPSLDVLEKLANVYDQPLSNLLEASGHLTTEKVGYKEEFEDILNEEKELRKKKDILHLLENEENVYFNNQLISKSDREKTLKILQVLLSEYQ